MKNAVEKMYTEKKLKDRLSEQKERIDYEVCRMREEYNKKEQDIKEVYNETIRDLRQENEFYKNIIKSILHI